MEKHTGNIIDNPYGFIYITTNNINNMCYIGQRKYTRGWRSYLGSGIILQKAIKKYGRENFTRNIIAIGYNAEDLNDLEIQYIKLHDAVKSENYYNIADGGCGNPYAGKTEEQISDIGNKIKKTLSSKTSKEKEDHKKKLSESHIGLQSKENHPLWGKKHSNESKIKMREARFGKYKGKNNPTSRMVICVTTGDIFDCIRDAERMYNIANSTISKCCKGNCNYAGRHPITNEPMIWKYYSEDL